jgi:hypothetical protein
VLADRVCIMSRGIVIALDSPSAIKRAFGLGYNLVIEPAANANSMPDKNTFE